MALVKTYTTPVELAGGDAMSASVFNAQMLQNIMYLRDRPYEQIIMEGVANVNTTSTTPVVVGASDMQVEVDTITGNVEVEVSMIFQSALNTYVYAGILIDSDYMIGDVIGGSENNHLWIYYSRDVATYNAWNGKYNIYGLTAGVHTFEPMYWTASGLMYNIRSTGFTNVFGVREL